MNDSHFVILGAGVLCLLAIFAGRISFRVGSPLLLAFIALGVLAGEDGPGGIRFNDFQSAYLVGSLALTAILFEGGLGTNRRQIRQSIGPAIVLATVGVAISAAIVGGAAFLLFHEPWPEALLAGAATAPTDAAAVYTVLRSSGVKLPSRVVSVLEVESGLNDPMSVFLTIGLVELIVQPHSAGYAAAGILFAKEMVGGFALGMAGGYAMLWIFRVSRFEASVAPVFALGGALSIFGGAQALGFSGFLAVYLAGLVLGNHEHPALQPVSRFYNTLGWLAQIALFLMLGLLVTPHDLSPIVAPALVLTIVLVFIARPLAVFASVLPFRWRIAEATFVSWAGLRGAVPIYLTIIPLLEGGKSGPMLFNIVFVVVVVSVAIQGWTISPVARWLKLKADPAE